jgi:hypothetical protein
MPDSYRKGSAVFMRSGIITLAGCAVVNTPIVPCIDDSQQEAGDLL